MTVLLFKSSPAVSSISKQPAKAGKEQSKKAKNPEVGKLTEADKASTGQVDRCFMWSYKGKEFSMKCSVCDDLCSLTAGVLSSSGEALCVLGLF